MKTRLWRAFYWPSIMYSLMADGIPFRESIRLTHWIVWHAPIWKKR